MSDTKLKRIRTDDPSRPHQPITGGKRLNAYTFDASDLTVLADPRDPLYDKRVDRPITRERILEIATRGVETPISVRSREGKNIVTKGKQRTKAVLVVNALSSAVPYTGSLKTVLHAIKAFSADEELVKLIVLFTKGKALKIKAVAANSGEDKDVRLSMRSENAHRDGDALADRIKYVQEEHEKYATPVGELAIAEGVSEETIKRWLRRGADAKPAKQTKTFRPSMKKVVALGEKLAHVLTPRERTIVDYVNGNCDEEVVLERFKIKDAAE